MFRWRCFPGPPLNSSRIVLAVEKNLQNHFSFLLFLRWEEPEDLSLWTCQWICFAWIVTCYSLLIAITQNIANVFDCLTRFRNCRYLQSFRPKTEKPADVNSRCPTKHKCRRQLFFLFLLEEGCHRRSWQLQCRLLHRTTGDMRCPVREVFANVRLRTFEIGCPFVRNRSYLAFIPSSRSFIMHASLIACAAANPFCHKGKETKRNKFGRVLLVQTLVIITVRHLMYRRGLTNAGYAGQLPRAPFFRGAPWE